MKTFKTVITTFSITLLITSVFFAYLYYNKVDENKRVLPDTTSSSNVEKISEEENINPSVKLTALEENSNKIYNQRKNIITETVRKVSPAIVGINVTEIREYRDAWSQDPFFRQFFQDRVYKQKIKSLGSGAIISADGYILTNDHVAGNAIEIIVTMTDGTHHKAKIVGTDKIADICLLKIEGENLPHIKFGNSDNILIGEWSIALGNPFGLFTINDKPTVTVGVISSVGMNLGQSEGRYYFDMIQTDASINSGNSGGALVNSLGDMIGINTIIYTAQGSSGSVGVGFAIPVNKVKSIVKDLKEHGSVDRNFWTGLRVQDINQYIAQNLKLQNTKGVIVTDIIQKSPADEAGMKKWDIILKVDNFTIDNSNTLIGVINEYRAGDKINLEIYREGKIIETKIKLKKDEAR